MAMLKLGEKIVSARVVILILSLVLLIPAAYGYIKTRVNYDILSYLPKDIETMEGQDILVDQFGTGAFSLYVVEGMEDKDVSALKSKIEKVDHVSKVIWYDSFADLSVPKDMLPESLYDAFNNDEKNATMMAIIFDDTTSADGTMDAIEEYEDVEADLLKDMFSYSAQVDPVRSRFSYENLLMRNNAKTRVVKKERLKSSQPSILQIVNVTGSVDIDDVRPADDAVVVEGAVKAAVLYVSSDDSRPLCQMEVVAPFSYRVETVPLRTQDSIRITPALNQITAALPGNDEVEIKAIVDMGMTIFTRKEIELIDDMTVAPVDMKKKAVAPGIVGYVVRDGDSIWSIAKQYYSSLDSIRKLNSLEGDDVKAGDRLIVVKCAGKN